MIGEFGVIKEVGERRKRMKLAVCSPPRLAVAKRSGVAGSYGVAGKDEEKRRSGTTDPPSLKATARQVSQISQRGLRPQPINISHAKTQSRKEE